MMIMMTMITTIIKKIIHLQIINKTSNQPPPPPLNMNDRNEGTNSPDGGQNNLIVQALVTLTQAIRNMQPAPLPGLKEQNIAQILKFHGYGNENLAK